MEEQPALLTADPTSVRATVFIEELVDLGPLLAVQIRVIVFISQLAIVHTVIVSIPALLNNF